MRTRVTRTRRTTLLLLTALGAAACALSACVPGTADAVAEETTAADPSLRALLPDDVTDAGVLTVGTDASYAPASFFAPDGRTVTGFEPDLAAAMGVLLGIEVEVVVTDFDTILDEVAGHEIDVAIAAVTDTADRQRTVDFVNYFSAGSSIVVQRGNPHGLSDLDDLCGQVVAVEEGTVQVDLLDRTQGSCTGDRIDVRSYDTNDDALVELRTGRAAAVLNDYPPAAYLSTAERTQADYQLASDVQYEPGLYGIAVAKDRTSLRDALRATLETLVESGEYERVLQEWDVEDGAVRTVTLNAGARSDR
jgi:polar amino acid transport system substrate-binding protein